MGISHEEAIKAQIEIENEILKHPNVVSVGVVRETDALGQPTGDYVIQVGVISIETYKIEQKLGQSVIPKEYILHTDKPSEKKQVHIRVIKMGKIKALSATFVSDYPIRILRRSYATMPLIRPVQSTPVEMPFLRSVGAPRLKIASLITGLGICAFTLRKKQSIPAPATGDTRLEVKPIANASPGLVRF